MPRSHEKWPSRATDGAARFTDSLARSPGRWLPSLAAVRILCGVTVRHPGPRETVRISKEKLDFSGTRQGA